MLGEVIPGHARKSYRESNFHFNKLLLLIYESAKYAVHLSLIVLRKSQSEKGKKILHIDCEVHGDVR